MDILEVVKNIFNILTAIGEVTFHGMNIYLLARRIGEEERGLK